MTGTLTTPSVANGTGVLDLDEQGGAATMGPVSDPGGALTLSTGAATTVTSLASTGRIDDLDAGRHDVIGPVTQQAGSLKATVAGDLTLGALTVSGGASAISATGKRNMETVTNAGDMTLTIGAAASSRDIGNAAGRLALERRVGR
jgi:hypothetical protein